MPNDYYNADSGQPVALSRGNSTLIRNEFALIKAGFDALPAKAVLYGGRQNYAADTGSVNDIQATLNASITALTDGLEAKVKVAFANTSTTPTLNVNGLGATVIKRHDGTAIQPSDIPAGICRFTYDSTLAAWTYAVVGPRGTTASIAVKGNGVTKADPTTSIDFVGDFVTTTNSGSDTTVTVETDWAAALIF